MWPAEGRFVSPEYVADGTRIAIGEMIKGGTTCFNDMYFFPDEIAKAAHERWGRLSFVFHFSFCMHHSQNV